MKVQAKRTKFTQSEDIRLIKIVNQFEKKDWKMISSLIGNKTPRQCRDRYNNYLSPNVQNKEWTNDEEMILIEKYRIFGPKWSFLTRFFQNRAAVNIKNHYAKLMLKSDSHKMLENSFEIADAISFDDYEKINQNLVKNSDNEIVTDEIIADGYFINCSNEYKTNDIFYLIM